MPETESIREFAGRAYPSYIHDGLVYLDTSTDPPRYMKYTNGQWLETEDIKPSGGPLERIIDAIAYLSRDGRDSFTIGLSEEGMIFLRNHIAGGPHDNPFGAPFLSSLMGHRVELDLYVSGLGFRVTRNAENTYGELAEVEEPIVC